MRMRAEIVLAAADGMPTREIGRIGRMYHGYDIEVAGALRARPLYRP